MVAARPRRQTRFRCRFSWRKPGANGLRLCDARAMSAAADGDYGGGIPATRSKHSILLPRRCRPRIKIKSEVARADSCKKGGGVAVSSHWIPRASGRLAKAYQCHRKLGRPLPQRCRTSALSQTCARDACVRDAVLGSDPPWELGTLRGARGFAVNRSKICNRSRIKCCIW